MLFGPRLMEITNHWTYFHSAQGVQKVVSLVINLVFNNENKSFNLFARILELNRGVELIRVLKKKMLNISDI
jgi:hypothetical protein